MRTVAAILIALSASASQGADPCYVTNLTYEVTRECTVRMVAIEDEGDAPAREWAAAVEHWTAYLEGDASSLLNYEDTGVPPTAKVIIRGRPENEKDLYCELGQQGMIEKAYVLIQHWDDAKFGMVTTGRESVPTAEGKLVNASVYRLEVRSCH